jgi:hypothetical protein
VRLSSALMSPFWQAAVASFTATTRQVVDRMALGHAVDYVGEARLGHAARDLPLLKMSERTILFLVSDQKRI